jgi:type I restriction enzyme, S subunit
VTRLPPGWAATTLGAVVAPTNDSVPARDSGLPFVGLEHVESQTGRLRGTGDSTLLKGNARHVSRGSILYARLRPYLNKVYAADFDAVASTEFFIFHPSSSLVPKFLGYLLNTAGFVDFANRNSEGIERPRLAWLRMATYRFSLPPLAEQRRIVAAIEEQFSRLDAAEDSLRSAARHASAFRASLLEQATAHDATARVAEVAALSDGPFGSNLKTSHYVASGPRVVRLQNIGDGAFRDEKAHITDEHFSRLSKHAVSPGEVVATSLGDDVPRACLIPDWLGQAIVKADCIRLRPNDEIDASFLMWSLNSRPVKRQAAERIKGIGRPRLGLRGLGDLRIPLPPLPDQLRIVAEIEQQLSLIDSLRAAVESAQKRSAALRRAILERAFRGELVPQDPADEPASVLLERIRAERAAAPKPSRRRATMDLR